MYNKIIKDIKVPFKILGGDRIDDTPVHQALREALANCLVNTDFYGVRGVVIRKDPDKLVLENPGYIRTGKEQMRIGGISDPRNKTLLKMFNLINIGERAGSGVPNIFNVWNDQGWTEPKIEEQFDPDRTILTLEFTPEVSTTTEKSGEKKVTPKTRKHYETILSTMQSGVWYKAAEFADILPVKESRIKVLLCNLMDAGMLDVTGNTKGKMYRKKE